MGTDSQSGLGIWRDRTHKLPRAPGRYRYARFAGLCIAIFGAAVGVGKPGVAQWVIWASTAIVSIALIAVGERGVRRWQAYFAAHASPEEVLERGQLRKLNRLQVEYVVAAVAAFVLVLFIPVSPIARFVIFVVLVCVLGTAFGAIRALGTHN